MENLQSMLTLSYELLNTPFTIYGFTFSFWQIAVWTVVAGLLLWFVSRLLLD